MDIVETELFNELRLGITNHDFDSKETISMLVKATGGNMRTLNLLCLQSKRILRLNNLPIITKEVINAARQAMIIGI